MAFLRRIKHTRIHARQAPKGGAPKPRRWGPKFRAFSPSPAPVSLFFCLSLCGETKRAQLVKKSAKFWGSGARWSKPVTTPPTRTTTTTTNTRTNTNNNPQPTPTGQTWIGHNRPLPSNFSPLHGRWTWATSDFEPTCWCCHCVHPGDHHKSFSWRVRKKEKTEKERKNKEKKGEKWGERG